MKYRLSKAMVLLMLSLGVFMLAGCHRSHKQPADQLDSGGTGRCWDTSDDIMRDEAKTFTWSVDSNLLSIVYRLALGGVVPKMYLVTFVDEESLVYRDDYGMSYMWDRSPTAD